MNYLQSSHLPQLFVGLFILSLGIFVLKKGARSSSHQGFFTLAVSTALWLLFYFLAYGFQESLAYVLFKTGFSFVILMGVGAYHFCAAYVGFKKEQWFVLTCYVLSASFVVALWTTGSLLSPQLYKYDWGYYPKAGFLHPVFLLFVAVMIVRFNLLLYRKHKESRATNNKLEELRTRYVFWAICLFCLAPFDFVPNYGISVYPVSYLFAAIYSTMMAYSILRYQLMDIEVIIRRTAVFAGLFAFVYGVFMVFTILGQQFFRATLGWNQWTAMIPTVLVITFSLRPLEIFLTNATERFLFQKKYDYRELLRTFTNEILTVLDLQKLMDQTIAGLMKIIKLESACVLLLNDEKKVYEKVAASGLKEKELMFFNDDALIASLKASGQPILKDKNVDKMGESHLKDNFKRLNAQLCLPLLLHDNLIGVLCLGMKKSGEDYTQEDIDILTTLARTEAIAISNARLFDELSKTQAMVVKQEKMAAVGTLAAGMAHEIKNPLSAIRTFTEYLPIKYNDLEFREKFCRIVGQEVTRISDIVANLLLFSRPADPDKKFCSINGPLRDILDLLSNEFLKGNIRVSSDFEEHRVLADPGQLKQALLNVILNAIEAMKGRGGSLDVRTRVVADSVEVTVADTGPGIPTDKIPRLFDPFYTDKEGGTGLGLAITHSLVEKNSGRISVESKVGTGTVFVIKFSNA